MITLPEAHKKAIDHHKSPQFERKTPLIAEIKRNQLAGRLKLNPSHNNVNPEELNLRRNRSITTQPEPTLATPKSHHNYHSLQPHTRFNLCIIDKH